jgi:hypothetical protein
MEIQTMFDRLVTALADYSVAVEPDENTPEWWAGAPSVCYTDGVFYLALRMREGDSERGKRGYENRIYRSTDGLSYEPIKHLHRDDVGIPGFERPSLVRDPVTGKFRMYSCSGFDGNWGIIKFEDADRPEDIDSKAWKTVLQPSTTKTDKLGWIEVEGYKDPSIFHDGETWHMVVIGYDRLERTYHFTSDDGEDWQPVGDGSPILDNVGWHNCFTRPACVVPMAVGYLFVYEGSSIEYRDPSYNIATGLAYSPDLRTFIDLTPDAPILKSTTPGDYHTWRYSHWMNVGTDMMVWFEACRPNNSNETRVARFKADWARVV